MAQECIVSINGFDLCFDERGGSGDPPLLLIMGLGGPMIWWDEEFCDELAARGFRVIRYDNRDTGRSAAREGVGRVAKSYFASLRANNSAPFASLRANNSAPFNRDPQLAYTLDDMAVDAVGLLDHLGIDSVHVVGVSMGGMISQALTINHPERVRSLTSIMSTTGNKRVGWVAPRILRHMFDTWPPGETAYVNRSVEGFARIATPRYLATSSERQRDRARRTYARGLNPQGTMRQLAAIVAAPDRTAALRSVRVPTCVIHGTADPLVHVSGGRATARAIPGAELVLVPGMGHDMPVELWPVLHDGIERVARRAELRSPTRA